MKNTWLYLPAMVCLLAACQPTDKKSTDKKITTSTAATNDSTVGTSKNPVLSLAKMLAKKEVPVLCYHHIRGIRAGESESMKSYSVTPAAFAEQMKAFHDSGYHSILPEDLYNYLVHDASLPAKPFMITYDDTDEEQYSIGEMEMRKYGFKGVYFLMTIAINRPRYMSVAQIKELSDSGNAVECHTWDHHMVTKYQGADWDTQLVKPGLKIQSITNKPVKYFAYPFGLWNQAAIPELKSRGYKMAFILSTKRDSTEPLYSIRRMIVPGTWSTNGMMKAMKTTFHL